MTIGRPGKISICGSVATSGRGGLDCFGRLMRLSFRLFSHLLKNSVAFFLMDGAPSVPPSDAAASTRFDVASISAACNLLAESLS